MNLPHRPPVRNAFTLIELLVVIAIIGVLAVLALPIYGLISKKGRQSIALSNMRQVGMAFLAYAGEHNYVVPGRATGTDENGNPVTKWPHALQPYVQDLRVYGAPLDESDGVSYKVANVNDYISDATNNTSYIGNGYNDLGAFEDSSVEIRINRVSNPAEVIMLGTPLPKKNNFYMDFKEGDPPNNRGVLNPRAFGNSANYFFTDGSCRFLKCENNTDLAAMQHAPRNGDEYTDWLWLVDKSQAAALIH